MQYRTLYILFLVLLVTACNKDKADTRPSIKIKSVSSDVVPVNGSLVISLEFADKEGDISDSIFLRKIRLNQQVVPTIRDSFSLPVPDFPKQSRGTIDLNLQYQNHLISAQQPPTQGSPPQNVPDTIIIKIALRDLAGHVSDTVATDPIVVIR